MAKNNKPVVTPNASTQAVALGGSVALSSLFSVSDADGDAITQYRLTDGGAKGGYFELNGVRVSGKNVTVSAADLASMRYVAGTANGSELLTIQASDGNAFGAKASFEMQTRGPNRAPVVTPSASTQNALIGDSVAVSSLFTVNDPDGDAITQYRLTDVGSGGGYFELNGVRAATPTVTVSAADLGTTRYVAAATGSEALTVQASDGTAFGAGASFNLITQWVNRAPVMTPTASIQGVAIGSSVAVSSLFTVGDPDGDAIAQYRLTETSKGGYFELNGVRAAKKTVTVSAADLATTRYVAGTKEGSETLTIQAGDGATLGAKASFEMATVTPIRFAETFGSSGNDVYPANGAVTRDRIIFGLNGNEQFNSSIPGMAGAADPFFMGGPQNDTYTVIGTGEATVFENGNSSSDVVEFAAFGFDRPGSYVRTVDGGRHLLIGDRSEGDPAILLIDWRQPANRIEQFRLGTGVYSYEEFSAAIAGWPQNLPDVSWESRGESTARTNEMLAYYGQRAQDLAAAQNNLPRASSGTREVGGGGVIPGASLFEVADLDGDPGVRFKMIDNTDAGSSGYFTLSGVVLPAGDVFAFEAEQLSTLQFHGGSIVGSDEVALSVFDGKEWGAWWHWGIDTTTPVGNLAPVVSASSPSVTLRGASTVEGKSKSIGLNSLFSAVDADGDTIVQWEVTDLGSGGGSVQQAGSAKAALTPISYSALDFGVTTYVGGTAGGTESIRVRASDGVNWSQPVTVDVATVLNSRPTMTRLTDVSVSLDQASYMSSLFSTASDGDGDSIVSYDVLVPIAGLNYVGVPGSANLFDPNGAGNWTHKIYHPESLSVFGFKGYAEGSYTIKARAFDGVDYSEWVESTLTVDGPPPDGAGNTLANARHVTPNTVGPTYRDWVGDDDPADYYHFFLSQDSRIYLEPTLVGPWTDRRIEFLHLSGHPTPQTVVALGDPYDQGYLAKLFIDLPAGGYYAVVTPEAGTDGGFYAFETHVTAIPAGQLDYASSGIHGARRLALRADTQTVRDWLGPSDTADFYSFTLGQDEAIEFETTGFGSDSNIRYEFFNSAGGIPSIGPVRLDIGGGNISDASINLPAGTYFMGVSFLSGTASNYNLTVSKDAALAPFNLIDLDQELPVPVPRGTVTFSSFSIDGGNTTPSAPVFQLASNADGGGSAIVFGNLQANGSTATAGTGFILVASGNLAGLGTLVTVGAYQDQSTTLTGA
jgi:hypothetical protein